MDLSKLQTNRNITYSVVYKDEVDSTNTVAKMLAAEGIEDKTIVIADAQTSGKGRRGRSFESKKGQGIYMTIVLRPDILPSKASMITIVAAAAVRKAIHSVTGIDCEIKWPNDIIVNGKKLSGILTEMSTKNNSIEYVLLGIGINVLNDEFADDINDIATSVKIETGMSYKKEEIIIKVLEIFDEMYRVYLTTKDISCIRPEYDKYLVNVGKTVKILSKDNSYEAVAIGIDDDGELIIERNGKQEKIMSGEVSVRGVYGYV